MAKAVQFAPRKITADMAARGYNNEGLGKLIGYIAEPAKHEKTCKYRVSSGVCNCRIGLWQQTKPRVRVKAISRAVKS